MTFDQWKNNHFGDFIPEHLNISDLEDAFNAGFGSRYDEVTALTQRIEAAGENLPTN